MQDIQNALVKSGVSADASKRLHAAYGTAVARLSTFWHMLVINGEEHTKKQYSRSCFYRDIKLIKDIELRWDDAISRAKVLIDNNDETLYRSCISSRYVVECMADGAIHWGLRKSRKMSSPLFLTPLGYLPAFPEKDDDFFISQKLAYAAIKKFGKKEHIELWQVSETTLAKELKEKRYLRWLAEVKPLQGTYTEPRRTIEERATIYSEKGIGGLRDIYTKGHAFASRRKVLDYGLASKHLDEEGVMDKTHLKPYVRIT